jgi:hypothetical protein
MVDLGEAVFDAILAAAHIEHMRHEPCGWAVGVARWKPELDAVVSEDGVDLVGTAETRAIREAEAVTRLALSTSWTKANLLVRSMATKR